MEKLVIVISGVPGVGKTTVSKLLGKKLNAKVINLSEFIKNEKYIIEKDELRDTLVIDEEKVLSDIKNIIKNNPGKYVIEGHFAHLLDSNIVDYFIVLKLDPNILYKRLKQRNYPYYKIFENIWAQNLEVIESELEIQRVKNYLVIDVTGKTPEDVVKEIIEKIRK